MKKERPILMCGEMVRATLDGRKTMTRRVAKLDPRMMDDEAADWCPYGRPWGLLWVKETFAPHPEISGSYLYRADRGGDYQGAAQGDFKWKPSIFMPRAASRITLEIVSVRVERLQEITEEDAKAEGVDEEKYAVHYYCDEGDPDDPEDFGVHRCNWRFGFKMLWDSLNAKSHPWASNPWVWVLEFNKLNRI